MRRTVPFSAAGWEALRFFLLFLVMTIQLNRDLSGEMSVFLLWAASISLVVIVALFMLGLDPQRYFPYAPLVLLVKLMQILFGILLILYIQGVIPLAWSVLTGSSAAEQTSSGLGSSLLAIMIIVGADILSAIFLSLYSLRGYGPKSPKKSPNEGDRFLVPDNSSLPKAEFTDVDEEE